MYPITKENAVGKTFYQENKRLFIMLFHVLPPSVISQDSMQRHPSPITLVFWLIPVSVLREPRTKNVSDEAALCLINCG